MLLQQQQFQRRSDAIADDLAGTRAELALTPGCAAAINDADVEPCRVERTDGQALETPFDAVNIANLRLALGAYATNLASLAAGAAESDAAFRTQLDNLAASLGSLNGAVKASTGDTQFKEESLTIFANILAETGSLYFEYQRINALKRIIIETDTTVQNASNLLAQTDLILVDAANFATLQELQDAETKALLIVVDPKATTAAVRAAQIDLMRKAEAYRKGFRNPATSKSAFTQLVEAHASLAQAAKSGGSRDDLEAAFARVFAAAESIQAAAREPSGGGNGQSS